MIVIGIALATVGSFIASAALYALPPVARLVTSRSTPRPGIPIVVQMLLVVLRSLIASVVVAGLMIAAGWHGAGEGVLLGLGLTPFPAILLLGGVVHEGTPIPVACIHLTDWIVKLVIIGALVGLFL